MGAFSKVPKVVTVQVRSQDGVIFDDNNVKQKTFSDPLPYKVYGYALSRESMRAAAYDDSGRMVELTATVVTDQAFPAKDGDLIQLNPYGWFQVWGPPDDYNNGPFIQNFDALQYHCRQWKG